MSNTQPDHSQAGVFKSLPAKLALLYGSILVGSILLVLASAYWLNLKTLQQEEHRLVRTLGNIVSLAVGRSSMAGKHHIRRLIEEIIRKNPQIESIYVVSNQGKLLAHTNRELRDLQLAPEQLEQLRQRLRQPQAGNPVEYKDGHWFVELVLPFSAGYERRIEGMLVMRILMDDLHARRAELRWLVLGIGVAIAVFAVLLLLWASQKLARPLQVMAAQFGGILENTPMYVTIYDRKGRVLEVSQSFLRDFPDHGRGTRKEDWLRKMPVDLARKIEQDDRFVLEEGQYVAVEYDMVWQGHTRYYETRKFPVLTDEQGRVEVMCAIFWDMTRARRTQARFELAQQVLQAIREGVAITDTSGVIEQVNPSLCRLVNASETELLGQKIFTFMRDPVGEPVEQHCFQHLESFDAWHEEVQLESEQRRLPALVSATPVVDEATRQVTRYVFVFTDLSERKRQEEAVEQLAYYDQLTGLPNRRLFSDRLRLRLSSARRKGSRLAVMLLDLDNFKTINDQLGHAAGDQVLKEVANRLKAQLREEDTVARLGGDEFVIVLSDITRAKDVAIVADKIFESLSEPLELEGHATRLRASVGIVLYPDDGTTPDVLLQHADLSMYNAKQAGKNRYHFFSRQMQEDLNARLQLERELRQAIERVEFVFHYQPKVDLATGYIIGAEALIRWQHPERGLLYPGDFITLAEQTGLIVPIMRQLLLGLGDDLKALRQQFGEAFKLAINVSPAEFEQKDFLTFIERLSQEEGWAQDMVELEITENMIMKDVEEAVSHMRELSQWGFTLAIDDFGTGFSSLNYLKRFPIHTLKIDQTFIRDLPVDPEDLAIVRAMIFMADRLDLEVVAEGVETADQVRWLHENGCRIVQGYYFSRPVAFDELRSCQQDIQIRWQDALGFVS